MRTLALLWLAACPGPPPAPPTPPAPPIHADDTLTFAHPTRVLRADGCFATIHGGTRIDYEPCLAPNDIAAAFQIAAEAPLDASHPCDLRSIAYTTAGRSRYIHDCFAAASVELAGREMFEAISEAVRFEAEGETVTVVTPDQTIIVAADGGFMCHRRAGEHRFRNTQGRVSPETAQFAIADVRAAGGPDAPGALPALIAALGAPSPLCEAR